ncbi:MAG: glycoside hydrolase family 3 N-terminal domain-containing protein, partial [Longimicrobiales bacterium]|nr:glycoside hydrolase family 3 N-terminal domain-containing protein [Longimicrobiales bacterium]
MTRPVSAPALSVRRAQAPYLPVIPALRWVDADDGYRLRDAAVDEALALGVPGFILFGGTAADAAAATRELERRAGRPLLVGADLERGAGQQFAGATPLPPARALAALGDLDVLRQAGALTAREAVALGVPWVLAPVADVALEPDNPIVGTRAFGEDAARVAEAVGAWIEGCLRGGGLPCAKHFPGHGRTREDSHATLPRVTAGRAALEGADLRPFRTALAAGVPAVMTAHVACPALDPAGGPASRSRPIVTGLLRGELGFRGVVVTDALVMEGAGDPSAAMVEALAAGSDLLLYPPVDLPPAHVQRVLAAAVASGRLDAAERDASRARVEALLARVAVVRPGPPGRVGAPADQARALAWAGRALVPPTAPWPGPGVRGGGQEAAALDLSVVDDDAGGPYPAPARTTLTAALTARGVHLRPGPGALPVLAVFAEPRAWK